MRQPMESGAVHIARAKQSIAFPAKFSLVAAMNPCPCGYYGDTEQECKCSAYEVIKYQKKISGPLLDRIDIQIKVGRVKIGDLRNGNRGGGESAAVKQRVNDAREMQAARAKRLGTGAITNSEMSSRQAEAEARLDVKAETFLRVLDKSRLSPRGYYRILKVARTIADLENQTAISSEHLAEAFTYRLKEEV